MRITLGVVAVALFAQGCSLAKFAPKAGAKENDSADRPTDVSHGPTGKTGSLRLAMPPQEDDKPYDVVTLDITANSCGSVSSGEEDASAGEDEPPTDEATGSSSVQLADDSGSSSCQGMTFSQDYSYVPGKDIVVDKLFGHVAIHVTLSEAGTAIESGDGEVDIVPGRIVPLTIDLGPAGVGDTGSVAVTIVRAGDAQPVCDMTFSSTAPDQGADATSGFAPSPECWPMPTPQPPQPQPPIWGDDDICDIGPYGGAFDVYKGQPAVKCSVTIDGDVLASERAPSRFDDDLIYMLCSHKHKKHKHVTRDQFDKAVTCVPDGVF